MMNVPRWLKAYLTAHLYIQADDSELLLKIKQALPTPSENLTNEANNYDDDVMILSDL